MDPCARPPRAPEKRRLLPDNPQLSAAKPKTNARGRPADDAAAASPAPRKPGGKERCLPRGTHRQVPAGNPAEFREKGGGPRGTGGRRWRLQAGKAPGAWARRARTPAVPSRSQGFPALGGAAPPGPLRQRPARAWPASARPARRALAGLEGAAPGRWAPAGRPRRSPCLCLGSRAARGPRRRCRRRRRRRQARRV